MSGIIEERREGCKSQRNRKLKMKSSPRIPETTFKKSYQHDCPKHKQKKNNSSEYAKMEERKSTRPKSY